MAYKDPQTQKAYLANYYQENKEKFNEASRRSRQARVDYVNGIKSTTLCTDCGVQYHFCQMQFDHIGTDKITDVSKMIRTSSLDKIKAEIAKCELVCANCHALRTWQRLQDESFPRRA